MPTNAKILAIQLTDNQAIAARLFLTKKSDFESIHCYENGHPKRILASASDEKATLIQFEMELSPGILLRKCVATSDCEKTLALVEALTSHREKTHLTTPGFMSTVRARFLAAKLFSTHTNETIAEAAANGFSAELPGAPDNNTCLSPHTPTLFSLKTTSINNSADLGESLLLTPTPLAPHKPTGPRR